MNAGKPGPVELQALRQPRAIVLETVAPVPGMVGGALPHPGWMRDDESSARI